MKGEFVTAPRRKRQMIPLDLDAIERAAKGLRELVPADVILELVRRSKLLDEREREITECHVLLDAAIDPAYALPAEAPLLEKLNRYMEAEDSLNSGNC